MCVIYAGSHPPLLQVLASVLHYSNRCGNFCLFFTTAMEVMVYFVRLFLFVSRIRKRNAKEKKNHFLKKRVNLDERGQEQPMEQLITFWL